MFSLFVFLWTIWRKQKLGGFITNGMLMPGISDITVESSRTNTTGLIWIIHLKIRKKNEIGDKEQRRVNPV